MPNKSTTGKNNRPSTAKPVAVSADGDTREAARRVVRTRAASRAPTVRALGDIISSRPRLRALTKLTPPAAEDGWKEWLRQRLAPELAVQILAALPHQSELRVLTASAVWAARLRYALAELDAEIRACDPAIRSVRVRVQPPVRTRARSRP